jgi:hypothetical protein
VPTQMTMASMVMAEVLGLLLVLPVPRVLVLVVLAEVLGLLLVLPVPQVLVLVVLAETPVRAFLPRGMLVVLRFDVPVLVRVDVSVVVWPLGATAVAMRKESAAEAPESERR